jgi:hypothetical protein
VRLQPAGNGVSMEAEESPLLEMKTLQAGKDLVCAVVLQSVEISDDTIIKCSHESCVKVVSKWSHQSKSHL